MNKKYSGVKVAILAVLVAAVLNACATVPVSGVKAHGTVDANLEVRALAQGRWDALMRGDVTAAYGYLSPASRASLPLLQYQRSIHVGFWKRAVVETVSCEPEVCKVGVSITYDYRDVKGVETTVGESWVNEDGKWWFVLGK